MLTQAERCELQRHIAAQRAMLEALGVAPDRIYTDRGLTGTTRPARTRSGTRCRPYRRHACRA